MFLYVSPLIGSGCGSVLEHTLHNREVMGSSLAMLLGVFSSSFFLKRSLEEVQLSSKPIYKLEA